MFIPSHRIPTHTPWVNIAASVDHKTLEQMGKGGRCYVAVVAPIRKRWQLEKLENFDDPGWMEALLPSPCRNMVLKGDPNLLPFYSFVSLETFVSFNLCIIMIKKRSIFLGKLISFQKNSVYPEFGDNVESWKIHVFFLHDLY